MKFEQLFASAIEVGIATAGFSGIVAALGRRPDGTWSAIVLGRVSLLLQTSFAAILLSFLPLALDGAELAEPLIWRIGSGCFVFYMLVGIPVRARGVFRIQEAEGSVSVGIFKAILPLLLAIAALQAYNVAFLHAGWPFAMAVIFELAMAFFMFVRLIQTLWNEPVD